MKSTTVASERAPAFSRHTLGCDFELKVEVNNRRKRTRTGFQPTYVDCLYQGDELVVRLSAPYLMEICNVIPNDEMVCNISDPSRPLVFTPVQNAENEEFLAILMPMNVTEY